MTYVPVNPTAPIQVLYMDDSYCEHVEEFQTVLAATGRKAHVHTLGLDKAGVLVAHDRIIAHGSDTTGCGGGSCCAKKKVRSQTHRIMKQYDS